jgi:hypothetical protein
MSPAEFQRIGEQMYGRKHWRSEYAIHLSLDPSTVWRYSTREADIPGVVAAAVRGLLAEHQYRKRRWRYAKAEHAAARKKAGKPLNRRKRRIVVYKPKDLENEIADTAPDAPHDSD